ncbi:MAG: hypothetical protein M0T84_16205 [Betaproteobacteria bacterium]|nr:hypothetical protein [Betaproteobacteria bacterium]
MIEHEQLRGRGLPRPSAIAPAELTRKARTAMTAHGLEHAVKDGIFAYNRFLTRDGCYFSQPEGMNCSHLSLSGA